MRAARAVRCASEDPIGGWIRERARGARRRSCSMDASGGTESSRACCTRCLSAWRREDRRPSAYAGRQGGIAGAAGRLHPRMTALSWRGGREGVTPERRAASNCSRAGGSARGAVVLCACCPTWPLWRAGWPVAPCCSRSTTVHRHGKGDWFDWFVKLIAQHNEAQSVTECCGMGRRLPAVR